MNKILIFHDTFLMKGGAERMNIEIAKILKADIATAVWSNHCFDPRAMGFTGKIMETCPNFCRGMRGFLKMRWSFMRAKKLLAPYESILFSNETICAIKFAPKQATTAYYAHSISRHLFDLYDVYLNKVPWYAKLPYRVSIFWMRRQYIANVLRAGKVFVNSEENKKHMQLWTGRTDVQVMYPSVDMHHFCPEARKELLHSPHLPDTYFISFARLTHVKRVDTIIRAFMDLRKTPLIIVFGKLDSQKEEFLTLAGLKEAEIIPDVPTASKCFPHIFFLTLSDNTTLPRYVAGATASICISKNEDFGMVAIESLASGTPVIAVAEGGYTEILTEGETGKFLGKKGVLQDEVTICKELQHTITTTSPQEWEQMGAACLKRANDFSLEKWKKVQEKVFFDYSLLQKKNSL